MWRTPLITVSPSAASPATTIAAPARMSWARTGALDSVAWPRTTAWWPSVRMSAAPVRALDIRAGAAMVIAALCADGVSEIADMQHIDRGYEDFEAKLEGLGAEVRRERELVTLP